MDPGEIPVAWWAPPSEAYFGHHATTVPEGEGRVRLDSIV